MITTEFIKKCINDAELLPGASGNDPDQIREYQEKCLETVVLIRDMLQEMEEGEIPEEVIGIAAAGAGIASACCRTRAACSRGSGFEKIFPVILPSDERGICTAVYDLCTDIVRRKNRMFIPEPIERDAPSADRLLFIQRKFLAERAGRAVSEQTNGTRFSRMFGSRG